MKKIQILLLLFSTILFIDCNKTYKDNSIQKKTDSLDYFFDKANNDSIIIQQRKIHIQKALDIISKEKNDSMNRVNYFKIANRYFNINDFENYGKISKLLLKNSLKEKDTLSLAKSYIYLADYYNLKLVPDSSYNYYFKAEKLYLVLKNFSTLTEIYLNKAIIQHNNSDFIGSEKSAINTLKCLRKVNNDELSYEAYNILGIIYNDLNEWEKSITFHQKALKIVEKNESLLNANYKAVSINNIGVVYQNIKNHNKAIQNFEEALKQNRLHEDRIVLYAMLIDNLGYSNLKLKNDKLLPELFFEALKIRDSLKITPGIIINKIHLSEYYSYKNDRQNAFEFAKEAYVLAKENNLARDIMNCLTQLSIVDNQNFETYSKEYLKISDSLQLAERRNSNKFARIEFETEELTIEKDQLVEQRKTIIYIALGLLLIGVFIFVIRFQAEKNRELRMVQEQQQANEEIYQLMLNQQNKIEEVRQAEKKRIAQELHDGVLGKLFGTRMNLGVLNAKKDDAGILERVVYIDELKTLEQEIREISHDLNSEKTAVFNNFVLMVTNFVETQRTVCNAAIRFSIDPTIEWNAVDNMAKINCYRILQEAFQNINKHADAKNVTVTFQKIDRLIDLEIEDDGVGFNYARKKKGIGLKNMNARIENSGGTMKIETEIGNGTLLHFELPLTPIKTINVIPDEKNSPVVNG